MSTTVVVTGLGAFTPIGADVPSSWSALLEGRSGVRMIDQPWAADLTTRFAALAAVEPTEAGLEKHEARRLDRGQQFAILAARQAWADARKKLGEGRGNVIRQAEMLRELGVKPSKQLPRTLMDDAGSEPTDDAGPMPGGTQNA